MFSSPLGALLRSSQNCIPLHIFALLKTVYPFTQIQTNEVYEWTYLGCAICCFLIPSGHMEGNNIISTFRMAFGKVHPLPHPPAPGSAHASTHGSARSSVYTSSQGLSYDTSDLELSSVNLLITLLRHLTRLHSRWHIV